MRKLAIILAVVLIAVLIIGYGVLSYLLSPAKVRELLTAELQKNWQGTVHVGAANVGILPPSIAVNDVRLTSKDGKKELLSLGALRLSPDLSALWNRQLVIKSIVLQEPIIDLSTDPKGQLLLAVLAGAAKDKEKEAAPPVDTKPREGVNSSLSSIRVDEIGIEGLAIKVAKGPGGKPMLVGPVSGTLAVAFTDALKVSGKLEQASPLEIALEGLDGPVSISKTRVEVDFKGSEGSISISIPSISVPLPGGEPLSFGPLTGIVRLAESGTITADNFKLGLPSSEALVMNGTLQPKATGPSINLKLACSKIAVAPLLGGRLAALKPAKNTAAALLVKNLKATIASTQSGDLKLAGLSLQLGPKSKLHCSGLLTGPKGLSLQLVIEKLALYPILEGILAEYEFGPPIETLTVDRLETKITDKKIALTQLKIRLGKQTTVNAIAALPRGSTPILETPFTSDSSIRVSIDGSDLFELLKLSPPHGLEGTVSGTLPLAGTPGSPLTKGNLASKKLIYKGEATPPVAIDGVSVDTGYENLQIDIKKLAGTFFGGKLLGHGHLDLDKTPLVYDFKLDSVEVKLDRLAAMVPMLEGKLQGSFKAETSGSGSGTSLANLTAEGVLAAEGVGLRDAADILLPAISAPPAAIPFIKSKLQSLLARPGNETLDFNTVTSSVRVKDGALQFNDVKSDGPVGLDAKQISYSLESGELGGSITLDVPVDPSKKVSLPIAISGTALAPQLSIDGSVIKRQLTGDLLGKLAKKIPLPKTGILGALVGGSDKASPTTTQESKPQVPKDELKKKAGNLLKSLFR